MEALTQEQIVELWSASLCQGAFMTVAITGASTGGNVTLEFQNANDTTWSAHPDFDGTVSGGILLERVICPSPKMRIRFATAPSVDYWLSVFLDSRQDF